MIQGHGEPDDVTAFLGLIERARSHEQITGFIHAVMGEPTLSAELTRIGSRLEDVAAFAARKGYRFSADELDAFLEDWIAKRLPDWALRRREALLERQRRGELVAPLQLDEPSDSQLRTDDHRPGFRLDRAAVLRGDVLLLRGVPALGRLVERLRDHLGEALAPGDPLAAHRRLDEPEMKRRVEALHAAVEADRGIAPLMAAFVAEMGMSAEQVIFEWPGLRVMRPQRLGGAGYYRSGHTAAVAPHRDTWYGSPQHQINVWAPVHPLAEGAELQIYPTYYRRSVGNSSLGYDVWRNKAGLQLNPIALQPIDVDAPIHPRPEVGDLVCFAAHQLHGSGVNQGDALRVSVEFRLLDQADDGAAYAPPNIDYHGFGEIYDGWFHCDGSPVR